MTSNEQRIVCAANRYGAVIVCGARHFDMVMHGVLGKLFCDAEHAQDCEQGFIDNSGKFHNRYEAFKIAEAAGQIRHKTGGPEPRLYSEDLY